MDDRISAIINKALEGLSMRSVAIAQNVANANSAQYRPVQVSFEEELRAAAAQGPNAVRSVDIKLEQSPSTKLRTDLELAKASATSLRYGALVDVLGREMQLQRLAIRGGQ